MKIVRKPYLRAWRTIKYATLLWVTRNELYRPELEHYTHMTHFMEAA